MTHIESTRPFVSRTQAEALADAQAQLLKTRMRAAELEDALRHIYRLSAELDGSPAGNLEYRRYAHSTARAALKEQK